MSDVYGTNENMLLKDPKSGELRAEAEFYSFAPAPCTCCGCLVPDAQRKRMFVHVYNNRMEINKPIAPLCCVTQDICMTDQARVFFFDKPFHRVGPAPCPLCMIPCTCCGPPVIFSHKPMLCCLDLSPYCGEVIKAAPCNCFGLKAYLCCGNPCYVSCSLPLVGGLKNSDAFLGKYKAAFNEFKSRTNIPDGELVIFESVSDNIADFGGSRQVEVGLTAQGGAPAALVIDHDGREDAGVEMA